MFIGHSVKFELKCSHFTAENIFENVVSIISAILSEPQWAKWASIIALYSENEWLGKLQYCHEARFRPEHGCKCSCNENTVCNSLNFRVLPGARLTKAYDVTIQRYRNSHAKIHDSKMHILRCMGSKFCVKFQRCPLKFHTKFWTHTPPNMHFMRW